MRWAWLLPLLVALPASAAELADLDWLVGGWEGEAFGGHIEEIWLERNGDAMHAVFRATQDGRMEFSEFMQLTQEDDEVILRFAHFRPDYSTWEEPGEWMTLRLAAAHDGLARFEGVDDASVGLIEYERGEDGVVSVTVTGLSAPIRMSPTD